MSLFYSYKQGRTSRKATYYSSYFVLGSVDVNQISIWCKNISYLSSTRPAMQLSLVTRLQRISMMSNWKILKSKNNILLVQLHKSFGLRLYAITKSNLKKLQKQTLTIIKNLGWRDSVRSLLSKLQIATVSVYLWINIVCKRADNKRC